MVVSVFGEEYLDLKNGNMKIERFLNMKKRILIGEGLYSQWVKVLRKHNLLFRLWIYL